MIRTNLSTRPFYNERIVRGVLGAVAIVAVALSVFNAAQIVQLTGENRRLSAEADGAAAQARALRGEAQDIRRRLNQAEVEAVQAAAAEANQLIERRAFSWTELFNRFERTLPPNVRIAAVSPQVDNAGRLLVSITVISRRVEDLDAFIGALEQTGAFRAILSREEETQEDGTLRSAIQGYYRRPDEPADPPAASSEATGPAAGGAAGATTGAPGGAPR